MNLDNRRITIKEISYYVSLQFDSRQAIFTDVLDMVRAAAKIVTKLKNFEHKQNRMGSAQKALTMFNGDSDLVKKVITGDGL